MRGKRQMARDVGMSSDPALEDKHCLACAGGRDGCHRSPAGGGGGGIAWEARGRHRQLHPAGDCWDRVGAGQGGVELSDEE